MIICQIFDHPDSYLDTLCIEIYDKYLLVNRTIIFITCVQQKKTHGDLYKHCSLSKKYHFMKFSDWSILPGGQQGDFFVFCVMSLVKSRLLQLSFVWLLPCYVWLLPMLCVDLARCWHNTRSMGTSQEGSLLYNIDYLHLTIASCKPTKIGEVYG